MLEWAEWRIWAPGLEMVAEKGVSDMDIGVCVHRGRFCFFGLDWIGSNRQREMMIGIEIEIEILQRNGQEEEE